MPMKSPLKLIQKKRKKERNTKTKTFTLLQDLHPAVRRTAGCTWESLEDSEDPSMDDLGKQHFENIDDNEVPF